MKYDKVYVLDTNIILSNAESIFTLSQGNSNLIVIPEIVLDELDAKKSGFDAINFQARKFARVLSENTKVIKTEMDGNFSNVLLELKSGEHVEIVSKEVYDVSIHDTAINIINDRKILEVTSYVIQKYEKNANIPTTLLSNDIMMRTRAISQQMRTDFISEKREMVKNDFYGEYEVTDARPRDNMDLGSATTCATIPDSQWSFKVVDKITGKPYYGIRYNDNWLTVDEEVLKKQMARPKNVEQKFMSSLILNKHIDIIVVNGNAGTGKNYVATSSAMRLMDTRKDKYSSIIYIRKTVVSDDKQGEVGFLPGSLEEKMSGYLAPLYNTLENFVKSKYKEKKQELSKEEIEEEVNTLIARYSIETKYLGHLRGSTISNAIVIIDEVQNMTKLDLQTTLSRMGDDVKVIVMGSQKQIDNPYLNQYNNALTYINGLVGDKRNRENGVTLAGCNLVKAVRSDISEWTDKVF